MRAVEGALLELRLPRVQQGRPHARWGVQDLRDGLLRDGRALVLAPQVRQHLAHRLLRDGLVLLRPTRFWTLLIGCIDKQSASLNTAEYDCHIFIWNLYFHGNG